MQVYNRTALTTHRITGQKGEQIACHYLLENGFQILKQNYTSRWGELDLIAKKFSKIHFIEVKTRICTRQGMPYEAVRIPKLIHLLRTIQHFILSYHLQLYKYQLDVISIILFPDGKLKDLKVYENIDINRVY